MIRPTFSMKDANKILRTPLASEEHDDMLVWRGEASDDFKIRSAYRILLESTTDSNTREVQNEMKRIYNRLWNLKIPTK